MVKTVTADWRMPVYVPTDRRIIATDVGIYRDCLVPP